MPEKLQRTPFSRVFTIENRAGPANVPVYEGLSRAMGISFPQGDVTPVYNPSESQYGKFDVVDKIRGARGLPTLPIQFRMERDLSEVLEKVNRECDWDIQIHFGDCQDPTDFNEFNGILVLEAAASTSYDTSELGALDSSQDAVIEENVPFTGEFLYIVRPVNPEELAATEVTDEIIDIVICDAVTCGACGLPRDGCQRVFALTTGTAGSPGLAAELLFTSDGGATWGETDITTLGLGVAPSAMTCVGTNLVVVSNASDSLHYAPIVDILNGVEVWTEVTAGFVAAGSPNAIFSLSRTQTWIVGDGGYVYFSDDITVGVTVQTAGTVTAQDFNAIHGIGKNDLLAVGAANALVVTSNGGETWSLVVGPAVGVALNTVWMRSELEWFIGDAGGDLWYTRDGGTNWTQKAFAGDGAGQVRHITFATPTVGYMAHDTAAPLGRILRTVDGGYSWIVQPPSGLTFPVNDQINKIAACRDNVNIAFGGGLGDNAADGFIVKLA